MAEDTASTDSPENPTASFSITSLFNARGRGSTENFPQLGNSQIQADAHKTDKRNPQHHIPRRPDCKRASPSRYRNHNTANPSGTNNKLWNIPEITTNFPGFGQTTYTKTQINGSAAPNPRTHFSRRASSNFAKPRSPRSPCTGALGGVRNKEVENKTATAPIRNIPTAYPPKPACTLRERADEILLFGQQPQAPQHSRAQ